MHLQLIGVKKSYFSHAREIPVLQGVDLELESGVFASLTGPSGAGKSTLLHLVGTLDTPSSGRILLDGQDCFQLGTEKIAAFRNQSIGFVFQFHHLLPELSALENVMLPLWMRYIKTKQAKTMAIHILEQVGLKERLTHKPGELSGGEQQRVALARALVGKPKLVLADEPTGNLDDQTGQEVLHLMQQYAINNQATLLMVTHHTHMARQAQKQLQLSKEGTLTSGV